MSRPESYRSFRDRFSGLIEPLRSPLWWELYKRSTDCTFSTYDCKTGFSEEVTEEEFRDREKAAARAATFSPLEPITYQTIWDKIMDIRLNNTIDNP